MTTVVLTRQLVQGEVRLFERPRSGRPLDLIQLAETIRDRRAADANLTVATIARELGRSSPWVSNALRHGVSDLQLTRCAWCPSCLPLGHREAGQRAEIELTRSSRSSSAASPDTGWRRRVLKRQGRLVEDEVGPEDLIADPGRVHCQPRTRS
jgi:hypothetical protein